MSVILKVRSALCVMYVVVSAAVGLTYQVVNVIDVRQGLGALDLPDANFVNVVWRALRVDSVISTQDSVLVVLVPLASAVMVARLGIGASQTAGRASVAVMQMSAIREPEPVLTAKATRQEISVNGALMVTMETQPLV